jgi:hypothetical protein
MTTTTLTGQFTPSASGVVKCPCGRRFHMDQRHVCEHFDNSATTIDVLNHGSVEPFATRPQDDVDYRPPSGTGKGSRPNTKSNRYPGQCVKCGGQVEAEAGYLVKDNSKTGGSPWGVEHKIGECVEGQDPAPVATPTTVPTTAGGAPMSPAQEGFLRSLIVRKAPDVDVEEALQATREAPEPRKLASALIDAFKAQPDAPKPKAPTASQPEVELNKGDVHVVEGGSGQDAYVRYYRVHEAQGSGNLYACQWDGQRFDYAKGAIKLLNPGNKITAEQAAEFGHMFERCCFCSHEIDTPESTLVGYGPVCAKKHDLPWG